LDNQELIEVFIINYNGENIVLSTIQSLLNSADVRIAITVIDDDSTDKSIELIHNQYPNIPVHKMPFNQKRANVLRNRALELAKSKYVFITDNDLIYDKKCLVEIYNYIKKDENIAACTPRLMYLDQPDKVYVAGTRVHFIGAAIADIRDQIYKDEFDLPSINSGSGICLINREIALKCGGFDSKLMQGWGSDGEFYQRLLLAGYKCMYIPTAFALHEAKLNVNDRKFRAVGQTHNRWVFILSHYSLSLILLLLPIFLLYEILQIGFITINKMLPEYLMGNILVLSDFRYIISKRKLIQKMRKVSDVDVLFSGTIYIAPSLINKHKFIGRAVKFLSWFLDVYWRVIKKIIYKHSSKHKLST
jgi:hypothetical protein